MTNKMQEIISLIKAENECDTISKEWAVSKRLGYFDPYTMFCDAFGYECSQEEIENIEKNYIE